MTMFKQFFAAAAFALSAWGQAADWREAIWREPQVRYLIADMTLNGGKTDLYRKYAAEECDPDSREAIRLWDAGARVVNTNDFERKWVANKHGKEGRVLRIVHRGADRTITGREVLLTTDHELDDRAVRLLLLHLSLGRGAASLTGGDAERADALRRWQAGARVTNTHWFRLHDGQVLLAHNAVRVTEKHAHLIRLNSDDPFPETNVRYFMADIALGGSIEFYRAAAERDHEMGCLEAVRRTEEGWKISNLAEFERKKVSGKTLITRRGSDERISGLSVKLSSDPQQ